MKTVLKENDPMPFGKHKGKPMKDIPTAYLEWLEPRLDSGPLLIYCRRRLLEKKPLHLTSDKLNPLQ